MQLLNFLTFYSQPAIVGLAGLQPTRHSNIHRALLYREILSISFVTLENTDEYVTPSHQWFHSSFLNLSELNVNLKFDAKINIWDTSLSEPGLICLVAWYIFVSVLSTYLKILSFLQQNKILLAIGMTFYYPCIC